MSWLSRFLPRADPDQLAARIMSLDCPLCAAPAGAYCDPWSDAASLTAPPCGLCGSPPRCPDWCDAAGGLVRISEEPLTVLHTARILAARDAGLVPEAGVAAQFAPSRGPHSLRKTDQEART